MHVYAIQYAEIYNLYAGISNHMHKICTLNAKNMHEYAKRNMQTYTEICKI